MKFDTDPELKEKTMKPGPGNYDVDALKVMRKAAEYKVGSSPRFDRTKEK